MGNKQTEGDLDLELVRLYENQSFFTQNEINLLYHKFRALAEKDKRHSQRVLDTNGLSSSSKELVVELNTILELKPIRNNPFADKIVELFASESGTLEFEDFLDMCSVFAPNAPVHLKIRVAFYIFDKDNDGRLDKDDIDYVISRMVDDFMASDPSNSQSIQAARLKLFEEADIDHSGEITLKEFEKLCDRMPDFETRFSFRIHSL